MAPIIPACGQSIISVHINNDQSDRLVVTFSENITVSDVKGFRLMGGSARITALAGGSGTNQLIFQLTDFVLPDDDFSLAYWSETGDAAVSAGELGSVDEVAVENRATDYHGSSTRYYVSGSTGSDLNDGKSPTRAFRTIAKGLSAVNPGDYLLLKRGDHFLTQVMVEKSGEEDRYITIGAYGKGNRPIVEYNADATLVIRGQDYVAIDNLLIRNAKSGESGAGVRIEHDSDYAVISNCIIEGSNGASFGVHLQKNGGPDADLETRFVYPMVTNNHISGFRTNIRASGYRFNGGYEVLGGLFENNVLRNSTADDGVNVQRGRFHNLVLLKNDIAGYDDDGIDTYAAFDVIVEHNTIHDPQPTSTRGKAIKAGGIVQDVENPGYEGARSEGIIVRYNIIRNITAGDGCACDGIVTNGGASGEIYGNVIYDVQGHGIKVDGMPVSWKIFHNTSVRAERTGLQFYVDDAATGHITLANNILDGEISDLSFARAAGLSIDGGNNIVIGSTVASHAAYSGEGDIAGSISLFEDFNNNDFRPVSGGVAHEAAADLFGQYVADARGLSINGLPDIGAYEVGPLVGLATPGPIVSIVPGEGSRPIGISVYPAAQEGRIMVERMDGLRSVDVLDLTGRLQFRQLFDESDGAPAIEIRNLKTGIYIARFSVGRRFMTTRFVKQ